MHYDYLDFNTGAIATSIGEVTQGIGCAVWTDSCTPIVSVPDIFMKRCNAYNIYYLTPPTNCSSAYCMG